MVNRRSFIAAGVGVAVAAVVAPLASADAATALTLSVLVYASGAYPARPSGAVGGTIRYIGPTQPAGWLIGDEWIQTPS